MLSPPFLTSHIPWGHFPHASRCYICRKISGQPLSLCCSFFPCSNTCLPQNLFKTQLQFTSFYINSVDSRPENASFRTAAAVSQPRKSHQKPSQVTRLLVNTDIGQRKILLATTRLDASAAFSPPAQRLTSEHKCQWAESGLSCLSNISIHLKTKHLLWVSWHRKTWSKFFLFIFFYFTFSPPALQEMPWATAPQAALRCSLLHSKAVPGSEALPGEPVNRPGRPSSAVAARDSAAQRPPAGGPRRPSPRAPSVRRPPPTPPPAPAALPCAAARRGRPPLPHASPRGSGCARGAPLPPAPPVRSAAKRIGPPGLATGNAVDGAAPRSAPPTGPTRLPRGQK